MGRVNNFRRFKTNLNGAISADKNPVNFYNISSIIPDLQDRELAFVHYFESGCIEISFPANREFHGPFIVHLNRLFRLAKDRISLQINTIVFNIRKDILTAINYHCGRLRQTSSTKHQKLQ